MEPSRKHSPPAPAGLEDWISVPEAARMLEVQRQTVYNRCLAGTLEYARFAGRIVVSRASVEQARETAAA